MTLVEVFVDAGLPQKIAMVSLAASVPAICVATAIALKHGPSNGFWRRFVAAHQMAGPALGIFIGALNSYHMAETIQRLPFDPTLKQLAPGIFEVSTFVALGALVGLAAMIAHATIDCEAAYKRTT